MNAYLVVYAILSVLWATSAYAAFNPMGKPTGEQHAPLDAGEGPSDTQS